MVNSSSTNASYMRQWIGPAFVQIMACRLFGAKPLSKPMLGYCLLDIQEQTSVTFKSKDNRFIHENTSEYIVCEMAILSRGRWVNNMASADPGKQKTYWPRSPEMSCPRSRQQVRSRGLLDVPPLLGNILNSFQRAILNIPSKVESYATGSD